MRPFSDEMGLADRFFTASEAAALRVLDAAGRLETFFRLWTRKEAYLKAHGLGLSYGLERVEVSHAAHDPAHIVHIDGDREAAARWSLRTLAPAPGYVGALALRRTITASTAGAGRTPDDPAFRATPGRSRPCRCGSTVPNATSTISSRKGRPASRSAAPSVTAS